MKNKNITYLAKKMIVLLCLTCLSIFPAFMILGKKGFLIIGVLFYWTIMTSYEIEVIKRKKGLKTVTDLVDSSSIEEYKKLQTDNRVEKYIRSMSKLKIIAYAVIFAIIVTLIPVFLYFLFIGYDSILFS